MTWADDVVLLSTSKNSLQLMVGELLCALEAESLSVKWDKIHLWALQRPSTLLIRQHVFEAEEDLIVLGMSAVTGGVPESERRIQRAWAVFHSQKKYLMPRAIPRKVRWQRWKAFVGATLAHGSWGWLWDGTLVGRIDTIVHTMVRRMFGPRPRPDEPYISWYQRATR